MSFDPDGDSDGSEIEPQRVVLDVYGVKAQFRPGDLGERRPETWSEAGAQIRGHLLGIVVAPTRLVVEALEGAVRLLRGLSGLPGRARARASEAHERADRAESQRQAQPASPALPSVTAGTGLEASKAVRAQAIVARLEHLLAVERAKGRDGSIVFLPDGTVLVRLGTDVEARAVIEAATAEVVHELTPGVEVRSTPQ